MPNKVSLAACFPRAVFLAIGKIYLYHPFAFLYLPLFAVNE